MNSKYSLPMLERGEHLLFHPTSPNIVSKNSLSMSFILPKYLLFTFYVLFCFVFFFFTCDILTLLNYPTTNPRFRTTRCKLQEFETVNYCFCLGMYSAM